MTLEQPAELNRYETPPPGFREVSRTVTPIFFLPWALCSELILVRKYLLGTELAVPWYYAALILAVCFFAIAPAGIVWQLKFARRQKRSLAINRKGLKTSANRFARIRWDQIASWQFEPVPANHGLQRLTVEYFLRGNRKRRVRWFVIILEQPEQTNALKSEVAQIRKSGTEVPEIFESSPVPSVMPPRRRPNFWLDLLGMFVLLHGVLSLAFGIILYIPAEPPHSTGTAPHDTPLAGLLLRHFTTREQLRDFLLITGVCLTLLAITLFVCARILRPPFPKIEEAVNRP